MPGLRWRAVLRGRKAIPPKRAPLVVKQVIWAANKTVHKPYRYGGGHGDGGRNGFDCSGAVSFAMMRAGLVSSPLSSGSWKSWGKAGHGRWITIYSSDGHMFMTVRGLRFDTAGYGGGGDGPRWRPVPRPKNGFSARKTRGI